MTLLDETKKVQERERQERIAYGKQQRADAIEKARAKFIEYFGEEPQQISYCGKELETHDKTTHATVLIEHDGLEFVTSYGRSGTLELHVLLPCPECGRKFVSNGTIHTYGDKGREYAITRIAEALDETRKNWARHQCEGNLLKPLARHMQDVAEQLGISVYAAAEAAYEHLR